MKMCTKCNKVMSDESYFCSECHGELINVSIIPAEKNLSEHEPANSVMSASFDKNINNETIGNICPQCGTENESDAIFCGDCGFPLPQSNVKKEKYNKKNLSILKKTPIDSDNKATDLAKINAATSNLENDYFDEVISQGSKFSFADAENEADIHREASDKEAAKNDNMYASASEVYNSDRQTSASSRTYTNASELNCSPLHKPKLCLVENDEREIATLGSGFVQNLVTSSSPSAVSALLTDKRMYCSGKILMGSGKKTYYVKTSKIIEVDDITGTGFSYKSNIIPLIIAILCIPCFCIFGWLYDQIILPYLMVGIIAAIFAFMFYFFKRETFFSIDYAGGSISFSIKWLSPEDCNNFQRQIHLIKTKRKNERTKNNG